MSWTKRLAQILLRNAGSPGSRSKRSPPPRARRVAVEALEDRRLLSVGGTVDFGDLPDNYGTTLVADGPRHEAVGPTLGAARDAEVDGLPTVGADGDGTDEDGVTFGSIMVGQLDTSVTVNVQNAPSGAKLDAWIDFDGDGSFGGAWERIADTVAVSEGDNALQIDVPSWAASGETYARFRLSSSGDLGPIGEAADGEVEDYRVAIAPPVGDIVGFGEAKFVGESESSGATMGLNPGPVTSIVTADFNGDGLMDVAAKANDTVRISWFENLGDGHFTAHTIDASPTFMSSNLVAEDMNGDGYTDLLCSFTSQGFSIRWYENDGSGNFTSHEFPVAIFADSVSAADINRDGHVDILGAFSFTDKIHWYENDGSGNFTEHTAATLATADQLCSALSADVNGDGHMDVVAASAAGVAWFENDGSQAFTQHAISDSSSDIWQIHAADFNGDGHLDLLSIDINGSKIVWFENDGHGDFGEHTVSASLGGYEGVTVGDISGDGDTDLLIGSPGNNQITYFENDGLGGFAIHAIIESPAVPRATADINGDGRLDFLASEGRGTFWFESTLRLNDLGDLPDNYGTTLASDGARHEAIGPTLGAARDFEANGLPTIGADGDDGDGSDDEDGVTFDTIRVGQLDASATVNVQNAPSGAKLEAWIDFNGDGSFGGSGERIAKAVDVVEGDNVIGFDVPSWAAPGETYARFRLSTDGGLGPRGAAVDGEVEDYQVVIAPSRFGGILASPHTVVDDTRAFYHAILTADFDEDGHVDVLSGDSVVVAHGNDNTIAWHENDGSGNFIEHAIRVSQNIGLRIDVADVNGDGHVDVLSSGYAGGGIVWFENDGSGNFTEHAIGTSSDFAPFAVDIDGDGHMDVLARDGSAISWYGNDGSEIFTKHEIGTPANPPGAYVAVDVNGDGHMDVAFNSTNNIIGWYENDGNENFTEHTILAQSSIPGPIIAAADMNGDGHMDILSTAAGGGGFLYGIAWFENDGNGNFTERAVGVALGAARSVRVADVDGDGHLDVLATSEVTQRNAWYENDGTGVFVQHLIDSTTTSSDIGAADINGNGRLDVLVSFHRKIAWYENTSPPDFGDAPDSYGTMLAADGARHVATGPTLGAEHDGEADGQPTASADGDDTASRPDEDGVAFGTIRVGQLDASMTVNVQNAPSGAKLDAWIDFNGDGTFGGAGERIAGAVDVVEGDNTIEFDVPSWAASGNTYARFRLSTAGDLGPRGLALDGEVEDYQVTITPPAEGGVLWSHRVVAETSVANTYYGSVRVADFNGDGRMDVFSDSVVLGPSDFRIAWHENDGSGGFTEHAIGTSRDMWSGYSDVADANGDGHMDVLTSAHNGDGVFWFENDGGGNFIERAISASSGEIKPVAADVNGDGHMDILAHDGSSMFWHENDGNENFTKHAIGSVSHGLESLIAVDINGDGHMDVVFNSQFSSVAWYENDGNESFTEHTIEVLPNGARFVAAADINGDGHVDVISEAFSLEGPYSILTWYENDGNGDFTKHVISTIGSTGSIGVADLNGDGFVDLLPAPFPVASNMPLSEIVWYENDGIGGFVAHQTGAMATTFDIVPADMNGDGSLDFLTSWTSVVWHENAPPSDFGDAPDSYGTTWAADGARHAATGPTLGGTRDVEADGLPTVAADGDDTSATADEDGVTFNSYLVVGRADLLLTVNVQNTPTGAKLDAWLDFDGNGTFDPGDQIADSINVVEGDNVVVFNVPASAVAGQTYARFRLSTGGDLAPTGLTADGEVEDYQVTIYSGDLDIPSVDLGAIDFLELSAIDLAAGPKAYSFAAMYGGYLTVDATLDSADGEATIRLVGDAGELLGEATTQNGYARVDHLDLTAGKTYALQVTGVNADVDLKIWNLVQWVDRAVSVHGTAAADSFQYAAGTTHGVTINGIDYQFDPALTDTIDFDGGLGDDQALLTGSTGDETASFLPGSGSMTTTATGFVVSVANAAHITANSGGGMDTVELSDSTGDDTLTATPAQIAMSGTPVDGSPYTLTANGFRYAHGYARNGGNDTAELVGSANSDRVKAYPDFVKMMGGGYFNRAKFFDSTTVDMLDGADSGVMLVSDTADAVWAMKNDVRIARDVDVTPGAAPDYQSLAYDVTIVNCERFLARAEGGDDWVELHDTPGKDVLIAKPHKVQMMNAPRPADDVERGAEYTITARGFHHVRGIADQGGEGDAAKLYDSGELGVDLWAAAYVDGQTWSTMSSPSRLLYEVLAFEQVGGYGFNGSLGDSHGINRKDHADDVDFVFEYGVWEADEPALPPVRGRR